MAQNHGICLPNGQRPYEGSEPYIFISYAHKDIDKLRPIITRLVADGYRIWFDEGIDPGTEWDAFIAEHIERCGYFIAFISENYLASDNCRDELNYVRDLGKQRLLVYLSEVALPAGMQMRLGRLQAIHKYTYVNEDDFYRKLYWADNIDACLKPGYCSVKEESSYEPPVQQSNYSVSSESYSSVDRQYFYEPPVRQSDYSASSKSSYSSSRYSFFDTISDSIEILSKGMLWLTLVVGSVFILGYFISMLVEGVAVFDFFRIATAQAVHTMGGVGFVVSFCVVAAVIATLWGVQAWWCLEDDSYIRSILISIPIYVIIALFAVFYSAGVNGSDHIMNENGQYYLFAVNDEGCRLQYALKKEGKIELEIPEEFNGKPVVELGKECLANYSSLRRVIVPDGVHTIGDNAFCGMDALQEVDLPASISVIGAGAFSSNFNLHTIHFAGTQAQWDAISKTWLWDSFSLKLQVVCQG